MKCTGSRPQCIAVVKIWERKFSSQVQETPSKHIFSKHDNRHAFPGSATYFENGLGRRRIEGSLPNTKNLIDWVPLKEELRRERPLISSYQYDFHSREKVPQVLVHHSHRQGQPLQRTPSTTYQHTYRSYSLYEPILRTFKREVVKDAEPTKPVSSEPTAPVSSEPATVPGSCEPTATDTSKTPEAFAPGPIYVRPGTHRPTRWTVSDCLHWHNC
ncbi:uncharacterized protein C3orf84 homolog isoform X3 [Podarcis raffonei]|uniref:uncharacterized protein C3orf84 homolog isoform X3 n=1 Tax=Podarcis raffonei TaxID=65483 RepID=UPI0023299051|nr:uncharacterized protein C3orf84 homolog isoform X3 [Podarcis raffonei]